MSRYTISSLLSFAFLAASHIFTADSIASSCAGDQLLLVAGNEPGNGSVRARVLLKSRLQGETTVINLPDHQVSSACGLRYPSRCGKLTVESTRHNDQVSSHVFFIPLEDGIFILKVTHNGSALGDSNYISYEVLPPIKLGQDCFNPATNCTSLGIFKIRSSLYSLCVSSSSKMCSCQIDVRDNTNYFLKNCQVHRFFRLPKDQISNVVVFQRQQQSLLYFFVENYLFNINLDTGSNSHQQVFYYNNMDCLPVDRLILVDYTLYIYCTNVSAIYHLNNGTLTDSSEGRKFVYPCSAADIVEVNLNATTTLTYSSQDGSKVTVGLPGSGNFVTGKCFMYRGSVVFLYLRETDGVYLFDAMRNETFLINNTGELLMDQNQHIPLVFSNVYFVIQNGHVDSLSLYDIGNIQTPLLSLYPVPQQIVVAFVSDLNVTLPTQAITSTSYSAPTPTPSSAFHTSSLSPPSNSIQPPNSSISSFSPTTDVPPSGNVRIAETLTFVFLVLIFITVVALVVWCIIRLLRKRSKRKSMDRDSNQHHLSRSIPSVELSHLNESETNSQMTSTNASREVLLSDSEHSNNKSQCSEDSFELATCIAATGDDHDDPSSRFFVGPIGSPPAAPHPDLVADKHRQMGDRENQLQFRRLSEAVVRECGESSTPSNDIYNRQTSRTSEGIEAIL